LDVGGMMVIDFIQYTIRQLPRYKAFASSLEKTFLHPKEIARSSTLNGASKAETSAGISHRVRFAGILFSLGHGARPLVFDFYLCCRHAPPVH